MSYFDIKRDTMLIAKGSHFWCAACCVAVPVDDQSSDPRYCLRCYDVLSYEAALLSSKRGRPGWGPVAENTTKKVAHVPQHGALIMSTLADKNITVDIIAARAAARPLQKRGPKFTELPEDLIYQWAGEGMGAKAITARLKAEQGVEISYKTIQRRLQRELL